MSDELQASPTGAEGSMIEGLFRARAPGPALEASLQKLGIDLKRLEPKLPSTTWAAVLDRTRAAWFPDLLPDDGYRKVGTEFARGFQETIGGKVVLAVLPMLNPLSLLNRWPRFVKLGRSDMRFASTQTGPKSSRLDGLDPSGVSPWFSVGILDFIFDRLGVKPRVRVEVKPDRAFSLFYEWD